MFGDTRQRLHSDTHKPSDGFNFPFWKYLCRSFFLFFCLSSLSLIACLSLCFMSLLFSVSRFFFVCLTLETIASSFFLSHWLLSIPLYLFLLFFVYVYVCVLFLSKFLFQFQFVLVYRLIGLVTVYHKMTFKQRTLWHWKWLDIKHNCKKEVNLYVSKGEGREGGREILSFNNII